MLNQIEMKDIVISRAKRYRDITVFPLDRRLVEVTAQFKKSDTVPRDGGRARLNRFRPVI